MFVQSLKHIFRAVGATAVVLAATQFGSSPTESSSFATMISMVVFAIFFVSAYHCRPSVASADLQSTTKLTDWASRLTCTYAVAASAVAVFSVTVSIRPLSICYLLLGALYMLHPKGANVLKHLPLWVLLMNVAQVVVILLYLPRP